MTKMHDRHHDCGHSCRRVSVASSEFRTTSIDFRTVLIGIGGASQLLPPPPTPPYIRVRIRRFAGLSGNSCSIDAVVLMSVIVAPASTPLISVSQGSPLPAVRGRLPGIQSHGRCDITASTRHFQRSGLQRNSFRLLCPLLTSALRSGRLTATSVSLPRRSADLPR